MTLHLFPWEAQGFPASAAEEGAGAGEDGPGLKVRGSQSRGCGVGRRHAALEPRPPTGQKPTGPEADP